MAERKKSTLFKKKSKDVENVLEATKGNVEAADRNIDCSSMVSTGSTILDLAISGNRSRYGGIPGGILVEIFGTSGGGKTALLSEILGSAQAHNGKIRILDPEGRLDEEYCRIYGVRYDKEDYDRPDTVVQAFTDARKFILDNERESITDPINIVGTDSIAALSTELEMDKGDKMGQKRAKDLSQEMRLTARVLANSGNTIICTNQVRMGDNGRLITPGGFALEFYSSLRLHVQRVPANDIIKTINTTKEDEDSVEMSTKDKKKLLKEKKKKKEKGAVERIIGIRSEIYIQKSSVDVPYRSASIFIMYGYGIDDIRGNLVYLKEILGDTMFESPDGKRFQGLNDAIANVEDNGLENQLREKVVDLWHSIEKNFNLPRKKKTR